MHICLGSRYFTICRCVYEPYIVTTSCLDHNAKRIVKYKTWMLGGHMMSEWTSGCMVVVMTNLSVTVKVSDLLPSTFNDGDSSHKSRVFRAKSHIVSTAKRLAG